MTKSAKLRLVRLLLVGGEIIREEGFKIVTMTIDLEQVCSQLAERKSRTKSSIELLQDF